MTVAPIIGWRDYPRNGFEDVILTLPPTGLGDNDGEFASARWAFGPFPGAANPTYGARVMKKSSI